MNSDLQLAVAFLATAAFFATAIIQIALAVGVYADATKLLMVENKACYFVGPHLWAIITLVTGLLVQPPIG